MPDKDSYSIEGHVREAASGLTGRQKATEAEKAAKLRESLPEKEHDERHGS
jgi:hypothetical protein